MSLIGLKSAANILLILTQKTFIAIIFIIMSILVDFIIFKKFILLKKK